MERLSSGYILLDGYPSNVVQAQTLETLPEKYQVEITVHIDIPLEKLVARIEKRRDEQGRADDQPEKFRNRLEVYESETRPILNFYMEKGNYHRVDGEGSIEEVFGRIEDVLKVNSIL